MHKAFNPSCRRPICLSLRTSLARYSTFILLALLLTNTQFLHGQWRRIGAGINGAGVLGIAKNDSYMFAYTTSGELYRRPLKGGDWNVCISQRRWTQAPRLTVTPKTLLYASDKLMLSGDNGDTWQSADIPEPCLGIMSSSNNRVVAISSTFHLMISTDYGLHWQLRSDVTIYSMKGIAVYNGALYQVSSKKELMKSTDDGAHWTLIDKVKLDQMDSYLLEIFNGWVCIRSLKGNGYYSADDGLTWHKAGLRYGLSAMCLYHDSIVIVDNRLLYLSGDTAQTWRVDTLAVDGQNEHQVLASGDTLWISTSVGVMVTTDCGKHWWLDNKGLLYLTITDIAKNDTEHFASTSCAGVLRSTDAGDTWSSYMPQEEYYRDEFALVPLSDTVLLGRSFFGITRSVGSGLRWDDFPTGVMAVDTDFVIEFVLDKERLFAITGMSGSLAISEDRGRSWNACHPGTPLNDDYYRDISASNDSIVALGFTALYTSVNGAKSWTMHDLPVTTFQRTRVCHRAGVIWVATFGGGVYRSTNYGDNWTALHDQGMVNKNVFEIRMIDSILVAASQAYPLKDVQGNDSLVRNDVYLSTDYGDHWISIKDNLPTDYMSLIRVVDTMIYVQIQNGALYCRGIQNAMKLTSVESDPETSYGPRQFLANTEISTRDLPLLHNDGALRLINLQGAVVGQWSTEEQELSIDLRAYSSGLYFLKTNHSTVMLRIYR